ncbi:hypothetical protein M0805_008239 [Coniferiporia weirii]|nr:hypothetical protein M0805_008239 [Coniferiporia weirii]
MDKCSPDLIALVVEHAYASDLGKTARSLGLVSKNLRALAKPLEFRALVIAGPEQLKRTIVGIERARLSRSSDELGGARVDVRHIFIHDLNLEHALAMDSDSPDSTDRFRETFAGRSAWAYYRNEVVAFWKSVATLIHSVSATLVTLAVIQRRTYAWDRNISYPVLHASEWGDIQSELDDVQSELDDIQSEWDDVQVASEALGALSGVHLPRLESLILKNISKYGSYKEENYCFIPPTLPSLRKLCIIGKPAHETGGYKEPAPYPYLHPLLAGMHSRFGNLTHLVLRDTGAFDLTTLASVLSGSTQSALTGIEDHRLPEKLVSVILQQGVMPRFRRDNGRIRCMREISEFVDIVNGLCIRGLEAHLPTPRNPEGYLLSEALLAEWAERALGHR